MLGTTISLLAIVCGASAIVLGLKSARRRNAS